MIKLRAIVRRRWQLLAIGLVVGVLAAVVSDVLSPTRQERSYQAEQVLVVSGGGGNGVLQDSLRITRGVVLKAAATTLGYQGDLNDLADEVTVTPQVESNSISITSTGSDAVRVKAVVDAFSAAFLQTLNGEHQAGIQAAQAKVDQAQAALRLFDQINPSIAQADNTADANVQNLVNQRQALEEAVNDAQAELGTAQQGASDSGQVYSTLGSEDPKPVASNLISVPTSLPFRLVLLSVLGLLLAGVVVFLLERAVPRIDTRDELAEALDVPILAEIGHLSKGQRAHHEDGRLSLNGVWGEPYRRVRAAVQFVQHLAEQNPDVAPVRPITGSSSSPAGTSAQVFLITSMQPSEGKSTTAALTAMALAEAGSPTVLIGADFRKPEIDRLVGVRSDRSLQDLARLDVARPTVDEVVVTTPNENLWIAGSGPATREVTRLIPAAAEIMAEASRRGATVVVDSSPLAAANDTIDLLPYVDQVILVVRSGRSTAAALRDEVELIRRHDAAVLGVVLVGTPGVGKQQSYYRDYYRSAELAALESRPLPDRSQLASQPDAQTGSDSTGTGY